MARTAAELLVACLAEQECSRVFTVPGESFLPVLDALHGHPNIQTITCRQEGGAAFMACADGSITGRPGVAFVTRGPGATNASIGVHVAFQDSQPMILFVGDVARGMRGREGFQEIDFPAFFGPLGGDPAGPSRADMLRRMGAAPMAETMLTPDQALAAAKPFATGALRSIGWPTVPAAQWTVTFARNGGPAEVKVADSDGSAAAPEPLRPETTARLMRRIHDGTGMGPLWQAIIFLGGLIPAALAVTGVMMWLRGRKVRGSVRAAFAAQKDQAERQRRSAG